MARHPLQRLESPARSISALIHILGIASFQSSLWVSDSFMNLLPGVERDFGGRFKFLTIIGVALAEITFVFGLLADLSLSPSLFHVKNLLAMCATPANLLVSILFWGLCAWDKDLVMLPDLRVPILVDIGFHAMPAILLSMDVLLLSPPWTIQLHSASVLSLVFAALYWIWTEICFSQNGWYPYPIFTLLNVWQRVFLFATGGLVMTGCIMSMKWLHGQLNGTQLNRVPEFERDVKKPLKE